MNKRADGEARELIDLYRLTDSNAGSGRVDTAIADAAASLGSAQRLGESQSQSEGVCELAGFSRLLADLPAQQAGAQVQWSVQGRPSSAGRRFIQVRVQAPVTLECQRCMQPFVLSAQVDNRLEVVREPSELDGDEDEEIERIIGSARFDVLELIEDELILSLPSVPKHDICPSAPIASGPSDPPDAEAVRPSPFAVLERLKKD